MLDPRWRGYGAKPYLNDDLVNRRRLLNNMVGMGWNGLVIPLGPFARDLEKVPVNVKSLAAGFTHGKYKGSTVG